MTDSEQQVQRINGELHQVTPVLDQDGKVVCHHVHRLHLELSFKDRVQILVGATILAIPTAFTVEVWNLGDELSWISVIILAIVLRWVITSWLEFGAYDPLWVYGYQGRVYTLAGYIPADIGYYPQFLSLQYAYAQIVGAGGIDDHAARAILPFLQVGSIFATYLLGSRLFDRRTGIIAAALWALYPDFGYWTRTGDLEIPVTFGFTGAAVFFLMAWTEAETSLRRRYALISVSAGFAAPVDAIVRPSLQGQH